MGVVTRKNKGHAMKTLGSRTIRITVAALGAALVPVLSAGIEQKAGRPAPAPMIFESPGVYVADSPMYPVNAEPIVLAAAESPDTMSDEALAEMEEAASSAESTMDTGEAVAEKPGFFRRMGSAIGKLWPGGKEDADDQEPVEQVDMDVEVDAPEEIAVEVEAPSVEEVDEFEVVSEADPVVEEMIKGMAEDQAREEIEEKVVEKTGIWGRLWPFGKKDEQDVPEEMDVVAEPMDEVEEELADTGVVTDEVEAEADMAEVADNDAGMVEEMAQSAAEDHVQDEMDEKVAEKAGFWGRLWPLGWKDEEKPAKMDFDYLDIGNQTLGAEAARFVTSEETKDTITMSDASLSLEDYLRLVAIKNDRIAYQRMEWAIAKAGTDGARGMYEPALTATYRYTDSNTPNTTEEEFRRSFAPEFIEENVDYTLGVEGMVPTGGKVRLSFTYRQIDNNIQPAPIRGEEDKSYVGLSLTQPILKGGWGGRSVVEAPITVAERDQHIAMQTFRQSMFQTVANAAMAYWDLLLADRRVEARTKSVEIAESVLRDEQERFRFGQGSETRVMSAESAVAQRRVQLYAAQQQRVEAKNQLRSFVAGMPNEYKLMIDTEVDLDTVASTPDRGDALEVAFEHRPEYLASVIRAEKEDVRIKFARNNKLPQLDLIASYGLNGLDDSFSTTFDDAWDKQHETMYVGLEYKMQLGGNKKAKAELSAAKLRKHQALLEIRAAEFSIHSSVDTAISNFETAQMQVRELDNIASTNARLLEVELARFEAGQSNSRELLEVEERLNETMETHLESKANLQKALIGVSLAKGVLLREFDLER